ncbi:MAG: hypothetical protein C4289_15820, partial [Chloroflexota bacterium]
CMKAGCVLRDNVYERALCVVPARHIGDLLVWRAGGTARGNLAELPSGRLDGAGQPVMAKPSWSPDLCRTCQCATVA